MKIAIVSDLHLGDEQCALVNSKTSELIEKAYEKFRKSVGAGNDYLVLAGDILDFSVSQYKETYASAREFFRNIKKDGLANELIYLPGNHDSNVWHTVEHETNIINAMREGRDVRRFRHSVPAILDDRQEKDWNKFFLYGVTPHPEGSPAKYGGLYLDTLVDGEPFFNVAHPNLYLVSDNDCILVTHGHYFQMYWTLASLLSLAVAREDMRIGALDIGDLAGINFPLVQLACTGVGQSGPLTPVVNNVQKDVKSGELKIVAKYLKNLKRTIDDYWDFKRVKEWLSDKGLDFAYDYIMGKIKDISESEGGEARYNSKFCNDSEVQKRMGTFYRAALVELQEINEAKDCPLNDLPDPKTIVFGHTHVPGPWDDDEKTPKLPLEHTGGRVVKLLNGGGWLIDAEGEFRGANVFKYETGKPGLEIVAVK